MVRLNTTDESNPPNAMEKKPTPHRFLRHLTILLWIPAFAFLLPHGIKADTILPVLGILPMSFSAVSGLFHLLGYPRSHAWTILIDVFCAFSLIVILIPGWIFLAQGHGSQGRWYVGSGTTMLGTYGTVPMMMSFVIHTYLALPNFYSCLCARKAKQCPHCQGDLSRRTLRHMKQHATYTAVPDQETGTVEIDNERGSQESKETFHSSHHQQQQKQRREDEPRASSSTEPRPSTDDESARLL